MISLLMLVLLSTDVASGSTASQPIEPQPLPLSSDQETATLQEELDQYPPQDPSKVDRKPGFSAIVYSDEIRVSSQKPIRASEEESEADNQR